MIGFANQRHALYAGWVIGEMWRSGVLAVPIFDGDSNWTPRFALTTRPIIGWPVTVELAIPEPADDWEMT